MKVLDLFSGIGGFSLGLQRAGMTTIGFCELGNAVVPQVVEEIGRIIMEMDQCLVRPSDH
jgi:tRNA/tmRNA/rRNA uracil-C5-methylase (TrmA/RlmC/RlmD family)